MKRWLTILLLLALIVVAVLWWQRSGRTEAADGANVVALLSGEDTAGFARAIEPGAVRFPQDLGAHPEYQTEWWYYTGNLEAENGRAFGFQFTIFRRALAPAGVAVEENDWRANQVYLAHFTVSDIDGGQFYPAERFSRGAAGLAGAQADPYRVWLEDWTAEAVGPGQVRLVAQTAEAAIDLTLTQTLPPVLHGDGGLSQKGPEPGNASYYYSIVRQETAGTVRVGQESFEVTGLAWKDHEWSTSALSAGAIGWDWFSLQLSNGGSLMFFEIRQEDGGLEPFSSGSYIAPDGTLTPLELGDWQVEVLEHWESPESGGNYPAAWRIEVPSLGLEMTGRARLADQELNVSTVYWEGAVIFEGTQDGEAISAQGYVEMTGYAHSMEDRL